jgi:solute carrier family 25 carnitine/acylcarnitine transporter 20/29
MYWLLTYPTDVIKSSMQTDSPVHAERKYKGWLDCATKIYRADGTKGFFKGFAPCLLRSFPANAVCFLAYEEAKKIIG